MKGNIIGEPIVEAIDKQIDYRQQIHGAGYIPGTQNLQRTPEVQNYLNNRNSWIKMASGVSLSGSAAVDKINALSSDSSNYLSDNDEIALLGEGLAKSVVLFNSTQKLVQSKGFEYLNPNEGNANCEEGGDTETQLTFNNYYGKRSGVASSYSFLDNSNKMYGGMGSSQRGLQPVPGIIDMSVECLNRGSIKKATIKLKAYNKFQFGLIELLYLRLGYSVMLEWGWDKYIDEITPSDNATTPPTVNIKDMESTIIENQWFDGNSYSQTDMINLVLANEERFKGNYGGFFGKVSNFSWTLNADNTYDITLNLITVGSVIESLNIKIPASNLARGDIKQLKEDLNEELDLDVGSSEIEDSDNIILSNVGSDKLSQWISTTLLDFTNISRRNKQGGDYNYIHSDRLIIKNRSSEIDYEEQWKNNVPKESRYFVRFEEFLSQLQGEVICNIINGNNKNDKEVLFELDSELVRCNYQINLVPLNANKVIFSFLMDEEFENNINFNGNAESGYPTYIFNKSLVKFATVENGIVYGKLLNCYLNLTFIQQCFIDAQNNKEEVSLFVFLQKICDGINESTGNCTDLEVVLKKDKTVVFIDQNQIKGGDKLIEKIEDKTAINVYGYESQDGSSSFVKDFKFQTKITPNLMNMVTIGATASNEKDVNSIPFQKWNKGLVNRFGQSQEYDQKPPSTQEVEDEKFKKAFIDFVKNGNATGYSTGFGYNFTYNGLTMQGIWAEGVAWDSDRDKDAKNKGLISEALNKYKQELRNENNIWKVGNPNSKLIRNKKEAEDNYMIYISRAFGGNTGFTSIKEETGEGRDITVKTKISTPRNEALYFKLDNDDFIQQGKNAFKKYLSNINKQEAEALAPVISGTGFIPLELSITMDGLSGVKIYNRLKINTKFLPSSYPKTLKFIVKGVDHKVSNNVWDTNISTISVPVSINPPLQTLKLSEALKRLYNGLGSVASTFYDVLIGNTIDAYYPDPSSSPISPPTQFDPNCTSIPTTWDTVSDRRIKTLHPLIQCDVANIINEAEAKLNVKFRVTQALRTIAEQDGLYAQGRTVGGSIVTNARGGKSYHNYGLAFDVAIIENNGVIWDSPEYKNLSTIASNYGFDWGGNFTNLKDEPHFQKDFGKNTQQLLANIKNSSSPYPSGLA